MPTYRDVQQQAKLLGLPATGPADRIARLVSVARAHPRTWSEQDFQLLAPHLRFHQDRPYLLTAVRDTALRAMTEPA